MIRKNRNILIITSLVILLPVLAGVILWNQLPERIPMHWNGAGEIDGWCGRPFAVFGVPLLLLALQWFCAIVTYADPKKEAHTSKMLHLVFWIIPILSTVINVLTYVVAMGNEVRMELIMPLIVGLLLAIVGNYLPKCRQNYTIGIKIPWTLNSEENWSRTHRFAGRIWVVGGLLMMLTGFIGGFWIFFALMLLMVIVPFGYSYVLHRKGV